MKNKDTNTNPQLLQRYRKSKALQGWWLRNRYRIIKDVSLEEISDWRDSPGPPSPHRDWHDFWRDHWGR